MHDGVRSRSVTDRATRRFAMPDGRRVAAVTAREMREIDRIAVEETGPTLLQMMEHAGRSMAELVGETLGGHLASARVLVLAGAGGNGGGGICAARHLATRVDRTAVCLAKPDRLSEAAHRQLEVYRHTGGAVVAASAPFGPDDYDIVVDALIGYGLQGRPRAGAADLIERASGSAARVLSLDLPSGLDADTGEAPGAHVRADATLTLHLPKPGLSSAAAGLLFLADLGIPPAVTRRLGIEPPRYGSAFLVPLVLVDEAVAQDLHQPGPAVGARLEGVPGSIRSQHRFLHEVFGPGLLSPGEP